MALGCSRSRTHTPGINSTGGTGGAGGGPAPGRRPPGRRAADAAPRMARTCRRVKRLSATRSDAAAARPGASVGRTHAARGLAWAGARTTPGTGRLSRGWSSGFERGDPPPAPGRRRLGPGRAVDAVGRVRDACTHRIMSCTLYSSSRRNSARTRVQSRRGAARRTAAGLERA